MKKVLYVMTLLVCMFGVFGCVNADNCSAEMRAKLIDEASSITASYEFAYNGNGSVKGFNINVYNVPDDMVAVYKIDSDKIEKDGSFKTNGGNGSIYDDNLYEIYTYVIEIYPLGDECVNKVKTLKVTKPKQNINATSVYCSYPELEGSTYCEEWITRDINKSQKEIETILENSINKTKTTEATSKCVNCGIEGFAYTLKDLYKKYKYTFIVAVALMIVLDIFAIALLIKNGKGGAI